MRQIVEVLRKRRISSSSPSPPVRKESHSLLGQASEQNPSGKKSSCRKRKEIICVNAKEESLEDFLCKARQEAEKLSHEDLLSKYVELKRDHEVYRRSEMDYMERRLAPDTGRCEKGVYGAKEIDERKLNIYENEIWHLNRQNEILIRSIAHRERNLWGVTSRLEHILTGLKELVELISNGSHTENGVESGKKKPSSLVYCSERIGRDAKSLKRLIDELSIDGEISGNVDALRVWNGTMGRTAKLEEHVKKLLKYIEELGDLARPFDDDKWNLVWKEMLTEKAATEAILEQLARNGERRRPQRPNYLGTSKRNLQVQER